MSERVQYVVRTRRNDLERAIHKLIKEQTGYCPEEDSYMLEHTHFYNIKVDSIEFDCDEGEIEYIFTFSDDGSLKRWGGNYED